MGRPARDSPARASPPVSLMRKGGLGRAIPGLRQVSAATAWLPAERSALLLRLKTERREGCLPAAQPPSVSPGLSAAWGLWEGGKMSHLRPLTVAWSSGGVGVSGGSHEGLQAEVQEARL